MKNGKSGEWKEVEVLNSDLRTTAESLPRIALIASLVPIKAITAIRKGDPWSNKTHASAS